jgi:hydroxyacylglutathione hydrolase
MKVVNAKGARSLNAIPGHRPLAASLVFDRVVQGHVVVDVRDPMAFAGGHIPGAFGIGLGQLLSTWAAWVVPYDTPIILVASDPARVGEASRALIRVGLDEITGYVDGGMQAWAERGYRLARTPAFAPGEVAARLKADGRLRVLDVRTDDEWKSGHICDAVHVMGGLLPERATEFASGPPIAVVCGTGYRSTVAASVLERAGAREVINVAGGMNAWHEAGLPVCGS